MAGFFTNLKRAVSTWDVWDKDENARQRQQWAAEDEEERRRREAEARAAAFNAPAPGSVVRPTGPVPGAQRPSTVFDLNQPLQKAGAFNTAFNNSLLNPVEQTPQQVQTQTEESQKNQILDQLTEANMEDAKADSSQGEGWFGRNFLNKKAIEERAKVLARSRATRDFQEKYGWKKDPTVLDYGEETRRIGNIESERLARDSEKLQKFSDKMDKVASVAGYVPITGSVLNLGLAGSEKLYKATGNEAMGRDLEETRIRVDLGMTPEEFHALDPATQQKLRNLQTLGLALSPLDFIGVGGLAKSGVIAPAKAGAKQLIKDGAVDFATKQALKKAALAEAKTAIVPFAAGTAASVGGQAYVGGFENVDPLEALKTGVITAGVSKVLPFESPKAAKGDIDIPQGADEVPIPKNVRGGAEFSLDAAQLRKAEEGLEEGLDEIDDGVKSTSPGEDTPEIPGSKRVENANGEPAIEVEAGIKSTNAAKIPDPTSPITLAKAGDAMAGTADDVPIADFQRSVDGSVPLQKAPPQVQEAVEGMAAQAPVEALAGPEGQPRVEVAQADSVDANGNPILKSDAQMARELAEEGIAPSRGPSVADATEAELEEAARAAANREVTSSPASLREREAFAATEQDPVLAQEIIDSVPGKAKLNVDESLSVARNNARSQTPDQLVAAWSGERVLDQNNPQAWVNALEERKVLNAMVSENVPGAREARLNLADAMSRFQSKSGQNLNILKVAYDEMPTDMKTDLLLKKLAKAGVDDPEQFRDILLARVERADGASARVKAIDDEIADFNRSITSGSATPEARARLENLNKAKEEALADLYQKNAEVTDYFGQVAPDSSFGQKLANWNRVSMLSSVTGRVFDLASTAGTATFDTVNRILSSVFARGLNGRVGEGGAKTALPQVLPSAGDLQKAAGRTLDSARGKNQVRDVMAEIQGMGTGRSELQNQSSGRFRNLVKAGTEAPTELTRFIEDNEIYRSGRQQADELGLRGDDAELYAESYSAVATAGEKYAAQQEHLKANMLHNNVVSSKVDAVSNVLLNSNSATGRTTGAILKSIVAPFTRFIGGMTHRTFTDMNVVHNVWEMRKAIKNGDTQMLSDALAKATTNVGIGFATATVLAESGVLVDKDANGDSYAGLYFHVGDRYIPVGFAGLASVPMIVGYGINQAMNADSAADAFTDVTTDTLSRVLASTGTAGFFGADNALQTAIGGASSAISPSESGANERDFADVVGSSLRQSIPAIGNDINAGLDQTGLNPTGEKAETKVLNEDGTQNPIATQIAKTKNAIPFVSQTLDRQEGVPARDLIDRATKGNRETGEMSANREQKENLKDWEKRLTGEGVPTTVEKINDLAKTGEYEKALKGAEFHLAKLEADKDATENSKINARRDIEDYQFGQKHGYIASTDEAVTARAEKGEYDGAIAGWQLRLKRDEEEGNTPESKLNTQRSKIKRYEVFRDMDVPVGMVTAYEKSESKLGGVGVTDWRTMMDSGDPKLVAYAEKLYNLDKALVDKGAVKEPKYYWGKGGRGGGRGGRGPRFSADIATQDAGAYSFSPIAPQKAAMAAPNSAIPRLEKVPNYSQTPKKISVKRGTR